VPTGLADPGEDIGDAAEREVFEETGVEADFKGILTFRQSHGAAFGKSDLYFVCLLKTRSADPNLGIVPQESEIEKAEWVEPEVYFDQGLFKRSGVYNRMNEMMRVWVEEAVAGREAAAATNATAVTTTNAATAGATNNATATATPTIITASTTTPTSPASMAATTTTASTTTIATTTTQTTTPTPYMVVSKLPVGFRPGLNALYHFPDSNTNNTNKAQKRD
jgi:ADP-ribose pyrophosphatase YjhB (NUDIX family)